MCIQYSLLIKVIVVIVIAEKVPGLHNCTDAAEYKRHSLGTDNSKPKGRLCWSIQFY